MDPFARELLDKARRAHDPTPEDRARKLAARIGAGVLVAGGTVKAVGAGGSSSLLVKIGLTLLLAVAAGGYLLVHRVGGEGPVVVSTPAGPMAEVPEQPAAVVAVPMPSASEVAVASSAPDDTPPTATVTAAAAPAPARSARPQPSASVDLEGEMALLASAQGAIQRGDYASALAKLDEHQRAYPGGVLSEERTAARVVALCGAGRRRPRPSRRPSSHATPARPWLRASGAPARLSEIVSRMPGLPATNRTWEATCSRSGRFSSARHS
jgi:hypothetical protein